MKNSVLREIQEHEGKFYFPYCKGIYGALESCIEIIPDKTIVQGDFAVLQYLEEKARYYYIATDEDLKLDGFFRRLGGSFGDIFFEYDEITEYGIYHEHVTVPAVTARQGDESIRKFLRQRLEKQIWNRRNAWLRHEAFAKDPNFQITTEHDDVKITGHIVSASIFGFTVVLDEPMEFSGKAYSGHFGMASMMAGHSVFGGHCEFSAYAIKRARELLVDIYRSKRYGERSASVCS